MTVRTCLGCTASMEGRRPYGRWCSKSCYDQARREPARQARVLAAVALRPRCMICNAPIRYGQSGVRYDATTCGDRACAVRRSHWFGPGDPAKRRRIYQRELSREWMRRRRAA